MCVCVCAVDSADSGRMIAASFLSIHYWISPPRILHLLSGSPHGSHWSPGSTTGSTTAVCILERPTTVAYTKCRDSISGQGLVAEGRLPAWQVITHQSAQSPPPSLNLNPSIPGKLCLSNNHQPALLQIETNPLAPTILI